MPPLPASITRSVIDISHHEAPIDFNKVAADGIVAIIAKSTQGATWIDPAYAGFKRAAAKLRLPSTLGQRRARGAVLSTNLAESIRARPTAGFLWGSYHFGTGADVKAQVEHYLATTKPNENELVCLDFEKNPGGASMNRNQARQFVSLFEERTGRYPVLYGGSWLKEQLNGKPDDLLSKCPLWISQYSSRPVLPIGWKKYALWQFTDGKTGPEPHRVAGIGPCDHSQYRGTVAQLRTSWPFA